MKLLELRPLAAMLMTSTPSFARRRNPGPQPDCSATVESPTSTIRTGEGCDWTAMDACVATAHKIAPTSAAAVVNRAIGRPFSNQQSAFGDSFWHLEVPRETERLHRADANPIEIKLVPLEPMAGAGGVGVMVVVPALSERQKRNPPVVRGVVARVESS